TFIIALALALDLALWPAAAQTDSINAIQKRFDELHASGNYPAALAEGQKLEAAIKAQFGVNHTNYASVLHRLGQLYWRQARYAEAEAHFKQALAIVEAKLGKNHPEVPSILGNLATVYLRQGKYAEAEAHYKRVLPIFEAKFGRDHAH